MSILVAPRRKSAVEACERAIRDAVLSGELAAGAALPPENDLATFYQVNRTTLRVAINRLSQAGLLRVAQGKPTVARDWWHAGPAILPGLPMNKEMAEDLLSLRRGLARVVLERLAATPPSVASRAAIDGAFASLAEAVARDAPRAEIIDRDLALTRALVRATDRPALALSLNPVLDLLAELPALGRAMFREPASNVAGWRALLDWLKQPDRTTIAVLDAVLAERDAATVAALS